ncbi:hypothetical protein [Capnocytophaga stomatis]|nr:hypothetical protein [Capnocytophaga stomatis]
MKTQTIYHLDNECNIQQIEVRYLLFGRCIYRSHKIKRVKYL